jgi:endothelin-converting enzyme
VVSFNQPALGLPSREYYTKPEVIANYRTGLVDLLAAVLGEPTGDSAMDNLRREKLMENNLTPLQPSDIEAMVDRYIEFESHIAEISVAK